MSLKEVMILDIKDRVTYVLTLVGTYVLTFVS